MKLPMRLACSWFLLMLLAAVTAPFLLGERALEMHFEHTLEAPSPQFWLGTDALGRDILSRILCGASVSLGVAFVAIVIAVFIGIVIGAVSGYFEGWLDKGCMAFVQTMMCFPTFFLILAVIAIFGPNIWNIAVIIGVTSWMGAARLVRAEVLSLKKKEFILAARTLGAGSYWILSRHLIPNSLRPVVVNAVLGLSSAILVESGLSFLGVGVQPPVPSWGNILLDAKSALGTAWWMMAFPGLFIFLTVLSANVLAEYFNEEWFGQKS